MAIYGGVEFPEPEIHVTNFELLSVLQGQPMGVEATDGRKLTLRLYTAAELTVAVRAAQGDDYERMGGISRNQAEQLTRPLHP